MSQCALCMSEVHPQASVCPQCGAFKQMRFKVGFIKGAIVLAISLVALMFAMAGKYLAMGVCIAVMALLVRTSGQQVVWVKKM